MRKHITLPFKELKFPSAVVQAQPGFYSLQAWDKDGKLHVTRLPIIAWMVQHDADASTFPLTPVGLTLTFDLSLIESAIALPDGRVLYKTNTFDNIYEGTGDKGVVEWREMTMDDWLALARDTFNKRQRAG
jgi:hypothetical protein